MHDSLTGPTQSANSGVPATFNYKVLSGTGLFAHDSGTGTIRVSPTLFPGIDDRGNFTVSGAHTYSEEGTYAVSVTIEDDGSGTATTTANSTMLVAETDLSVSAQAVNATEG